MKRKLPKRLHFKDGGYYRVFQNKWTFVGNDEATALAVFRRIEHDLPVEAPAMFAMGKYMPTVFYRARNNARGRKIPFELTREDFDRIVARSRHACEVTSIPFELVFRPNSFRRPFSPSLDRIDSSKAYTYENCRLVCCIVNAAMSDWGDVTFWKMVSMAKKLRSKAQNPETREMSGEISA